MRIAPNELQDGLVRRLLAWLAEIVFETKCAGGYQHRPNSGGVRDVEGHRTGRFTSNWSLRPDTGTRSLTAA